MSESEPQRPLTTTIYCVNSRNGCPRQLEIPVDPSYRLLSQKDRFWAVESEAKKNNWTIGFWESEFNGEKISHFICPGCSKKYDNQLGEFTLKPKCSQCCEGEPAVKWCGGCGKASGRHLDYKCRKCGFTWATKVYEGKTDANSTRTPTADKATVRRSNANRKSSRRDDSGGKT